MHVRCTDLNNSVVGVHMHIFFPHRIKEPADPRNNPESQSAADPLGQPVYGAEGTARVPTYSLQGREFNGHRSDYNWELLRLGTSRGRENGSGVRHPPPLN